MNGTYGLYNFLHNSILLCHFDRFVLRNLQDGFIVQTKTEMSLTFDRGSFAFL